MTDQDKEPSPHKDTQAGLGMAMGMLFGAALGVVLWVATANLVFFPIFVGAGLSIGLAIDNARSDPEEE